MAQNQAQPVRQARTRTAPPAAIRKGRRPPPENETKHDRFLRLARPRMGRALYGIRLLANLAADDYEYTEQELEAMQRSLDETKAAVLNRLRERLLRKKTGGRGVGPPTFEGF